MVVVTQLYVFAETESNPKKGEFYCMCKLYQHLFKLSLIRNIRYCINDQDPIKKGKRKQVLEIKYLIAEIKTHLIEGVGKKEFSQKANQKDKPIKRI